MDPFFTSSESHQTNGIMFTLKAYFISKGATKTKLILAQMIVRPKNGTPSCI